MTARGFDGRFRALAVRPYSAADGQFAAACIFLLLLLRAATEVFH
jgi:hypothetical protein